MESKKKVLITGKLDGAFIDIFDKNADVLEYDVRADIKRDELLKIVAPYHCIISRSETDIDRELIDAAKNLKLIARAAVGIGNIDVEYATELGILVFNTPMLNTNSAAELSLALMLASARKLVPAHKNMEKNSWDRHQFTGVEIKNKTIGIVGLGNVGSRLAKFLNAMDANLISYDPYLNEDHFERHNCKKVEYEELLSDSDIITFHVPKNKDTINMVDAAQFKLMKDGVILVNASRGGIVNEEALCQALKSGKVSAAGIDTWDVEPVKDHPLKSFPQVTMTPHIGASTYEAQKNIAISVATETVSALRNNFVSNPVNLPKIKVIQGSLGRQYATLAERLGSFLGQFIDKRFAVEKFEFLYRGEIGEDDWELIKIAFLKGYFSSLSFENVSYVNALHIANSKNISIQENGDKDFSDYVSAIRVKARGANSDYSIGGTIVGKNRLRLSYLQGMSFEIEPVGEMLLVSNDDSPGVIGHIGKTLSDNKININQFELSRVSKGGNAVAIVLVDEHVESRVVDELKKFPHIKSVHRINL